MQQQTLSSSSDEPAGAPPEAPGLRVQAELDAELRQLGEHYQRLRRIAELEQQALLLGIKPHLPIDPKLLTLGRRLLAFFTPGQLGRPDLSEERLQDVVRCRHGELARRLLPLRLSCSRSAFVRGRRAGEAALAEHKDLAEAVELACAEAKRPPPPRPRRKQQAPAEPAAPPPVATEALPSPPPALAGAPPASPPPEPEPEWPPADGLLVARWTPPPASSPETAAGDGAACQFLACMNLAKVSLEQTLDLWDQGSAITDSVAHRVTDSLFLFSSLSSDALAQFQEAAIRDQQARQQAEQQAEAIADLRAEQQAGLIVLGERERPEQHLTIGHLMDGSNRHVAVSQSTPQVVVALGGQDGGKTHLGENISESALEEGPGVSQLNQAGSVVSFHGSLHNRTSLPAPLAGLLLNEDPEQQRLLWERFGAQAARLQRVRYLVFPGQEGGARRRLAALLPLGLRIDPIEIGPEELDQFTFKVLMCGGDLSLSGQQPMYLSEIEELVQRRGANLEIGKLREDILSSRMREQGKQMGLSRLSLLSKLLRPGASIRSKVERGVLTVVDLHGSWLGADLLMPAMVGLMHQMSQSEAVGHRWFLLDEAIKFTQATGVDRYLMDLVREVRHRMVSLYLGAQGVRHLPPGLLSLSTIVAVFQMQGKREFKAAQEEVAGLLQVPFEEVARQARGTAYFCASKATDRSFVMRAQQVAVRPLRCCSGGGSLRDQ